ncbi:MAG TPA: hypothetical protein VHB98_14760 [Chloroflexota bacterium]|nr:hypothetical protein [Chloroflexota bacterium]
MQLLNPVLLTSFTVNVPDWLLSYQTLVGLVIGLIIGVLIGRTSR